MAKIRRNDMVLVITGKDRGKTGVVRQVLPKYNRLIVEGVNQIKKHQRPTQSGGVPVPGGIVVKDAPLAVSNVMLLCKECNQPARVGYRTRQDGVKVRVCRRCGADVD
jgi:large subunit ribosomal protein L24